jgi:hypothetical protein
VRKDALESVVNDCQKNGGNENGETPEVKSADLAEEENVSGAGEEEVVRGVVYIRSVSQTTNPELPVPAASSPTASVLEGAQEKNAETDRVREIATQTDTIEEKVTELTTTKTEKVGEPKEIEIIEKPKPEEISPPSKVLTKRRKKTPTGPGLGPGVRNRAGTKKEVRTIQTIEEKMKGVE